MLLSRIIHGILFFFCVTVTASSANESDKLALLAFKDQIHDDPLGVVSSWNNSFHYCKWHGITCSRRHRDRVVVLDLKSQELQGTLSSHIGNLSFLRRLTLTMNSFHGEIPQEMGNLFRLRHLSLNNNSFSGEIPTNLTGCFNLRWINLVDNKLTGKIPTEISSLPKLKLLGLGINKLIGTIPASLGNLTTLTDLSLSESSLEGSIPEELCRIRTLEFINLSWDYLTGMIPSCLYNLSNITDLALASNQLTGTIPQNLGLTLPNLQRLHLGRNRFTGPIPASLSNASRLEVIGLETNNFTGKIPRDLGRLQYLLRIYVNVNQLEDDLHFITSLTNCSNLGLLSVSGNMLRGSLPNSVANLSTQITRLLLGVNEIYGSIPSGIGNLINLNVLYVPGNDLSGSIPMSIGKLTSLKQLFLDHNRFSGRIPSSFGNLTQLTDLALTGNRLHGSIPPSLGNCHSLLALRLSHNLLNGAIPKQVVGLSSLTIALVLSHNALSGHLPIEVGNLSSLQMLDISENKLSGHIPATLGNCLTLEKLDMKSNSFQGRIPTSLNTLRSLEYLDLSHNMFSGPIPEYMGRFPRLDYLNLSFNQLVGEVPKNGAFGNSTIFSVVGNSKLCGGVIELKLPLCLKQTSKKHGKSLILKIALPVIGASLCVLLISCVFFVCRHRRKDSRRELSSASSFNHQFLRISYAELLKATNKFSADNLIGAGSYGSVYKGVLDKFNTVVAVKVLNLQRQGATKSFLSECNALRNLRHRNLVKIVTSCSSLDFDGNDFKALVLEFMPKGSLDDWLHPKAAARNLDFLQKLNIAIDVASALEYLHHLCQPVIIHCDLKPTNVLLDDDMTAHVADFGLAKIFSGTSYNSPQNQASTNMIRGSIGYVAPEYGMGSEASTRGDVYSYGILLLEMFTEKRPTDDIFQNGISLHNSVKMALPERVIDTVDRGMILPKSDEAINIQNQIGKQGRLQECLISAMKLGVVCSAASPTDRLDMREAVAELFRIRDHYETLGIQSE